MDTPQHKLAQALARRFQHVIVHRRSYKSEKQLDYFTGMQQKLLSELSDFQQKTRAYLKKRTGTKELTGLIRDTNNHLHKYPIFKNIKIVGLRGRLHGHVVLTIISHKNLQSG